MIKMITMTLAFIAGVFNCLEACQLSRKEVIDQLHNIPLWDKNDVVELISEIPSSLCTKKFTFFCNQITLGMFNDSRFKTLKSILELDTNFYTAGFVDAFQRLTQSMEDCVKYVVINSLGNVKPEHCENFINVCSIITQEMNEDQECVMLLISNMDPSYYTLEFAETCYVLSKGMEWTQKQSIISVLSTFDLSIITKDFLSICKQLSHGMRCEPIRKVLYAVSLVKSEHYQSFLETCNALCVTTDDFEKSNIINEVSNLSADCYCKDFAQLCLLMFEHFPPSITHNIVELAGNLKIKDYPLIWSICSAFFHATKDSDKCNILGAMRNLDPIFFNKDFVQFFNDLSKGVEGYGKNMIIEYAQRVFPIHYNRFLMMCDCLVKDVTLKCYFIEKFLTLDPLLYNDSFVQACAVLTDDMDFQKKELIIFKMSKFDISLHNNAYATFCRQLLEGFQYYHIEEIMDCATMIKENEYDYFLKLIDEKETEGYYKNSLVLIFSELEKKYHDIFLHICDVLCKNLENFEKTRIMVKISKIKPSFLSVNLLKLFDLCEEKTSEEIQYVIDILPYVLEDHYMCFINACEYIGNTLNNYNKRAILNIVYHLSPQMITFLHDFILLNPQYFCYVPLTEFYLSVHKEMDKDDVVGVLKKIYGYYHHDQTPLIFDESN